MVLLADTLCNSRIGIDTEMRVQMIATLKPIMATCITATNESSSIYRTGLVVLRAYASF
jgi:hypothetical protein